MNTMFTFLTVHNYVYIIIIIIIVIIWLLFLLFCRIFKESIPIGLRL